MKRFVFFVISALCVMMLCSPQDAPQPKRSKYLPPWYRDGMLDSDLVKPATGPVKAEEQPEIAQPEPEIIQPEAEEQAGLAQPELEENLQPKEKKDFISQGRTAFSMGLDFKAGLSNSYFPLKEFLQPVLEVDMDKMSKSLSRFGLSLAANVNCNLFLEIYLKNKYEFGSYISEDAAAFSTIPKKFIDFIAKGNVENNTINETMRGYTHDFIDTGIFYGMKIDRFKFRVNASYFVPLFYTDSVELNGELVNDPVSGKLLLNGTARAKIYTDLGDSKFDAGKFFKDGGFDLGFTCSYEFAPIANLNVSLIY